MEIPPRFAGRPPVHPEARARRQPGDWERAAGLAADVRAYGRWVGDEVRMRLGALYPPVRLPEEDGGEAPAVAWLFCRAVGCPR